MRAWGDKMAIWIGLFRLLAELWLRISGKAEIEDKPEVASAKLQTDAKPERTSHLTLALSRKGSRKETA